MKWKAIGKDLLQQVGGTTPAVRNSRLATEKVVRLGR